MTNTLFFQKGIMAFFAFVMLAVMAPPTYAADENSSDPFDRFGEYTEESDMAINHIGWDTILTTTVKVIQPSTVKKATVKPRMKTGSRVSRGSGSASREETNRVLFHLLEDEHLAMVAKYRRVLEALPNSYPLAEFNKDELLAYWLNLHNVILYEQLAMEYPISNLKKLRLGKSKKKSLWDEKLVTIEGVPLSLNDIQNKILIRHWKSPMVLYGLFQGSIGGPSLPNRAFTGENVHTLLENSAREFINSNRGVKFWGNDARVSVLYDLGRDAFPNWERDLASHLAAFGDATLRSNLAGAQEFTPKLYDWDIADTKGGTLSAGPAQNTAANLMNSGPGGAISRGSTMSQLPEMERVNRNEEDKTPEGVVSSEECGTDECPEDPPEDDSDADEMKD